MNKHEKKKMSKTAHTVVFGSVIAAIVAVVLVLNILALTVFDNTLQIFMGAFEISSGSTDLDVEYYKSDYSSDEELKNAEKAFCEEATANGITMLKHEEESGLPFAENTKFSIFSASSVNWIASGTGSGEGGSENTLKVAFESRKLMVNTTLWDFYNGNKSNYMRGVGSVSFGDREDYSINECPIDTVLAQSGMAESFIDTTAMFVFARTGGEGRDLARSMLRHSEVAEDQRKHYLEPDSTELEILDYLQSSDAFDEIVLIVNCNNASELGWTDDYPKIKTILQVPGTGSDGIFALPEILLGNVNPSGKLVDTIAYDSLSAPSTQNCDEGIYYVNGRKPSNISSSDPNVGGAKPTDDLCFYYNVYQEGIYVGYKYYETRYEDAVLKQGNAGSFDYADEVQYPFGFGLSLTEFQWSGFDVAWNGKECAVTVNVKNTGAKSGRDVVQIYAQAPYTDYDKRNGIEKSAVRLVGFGKTKLLEPGKDEDVVIRFDESELKSYDSKNAESYIIEAGCYYITAAHDAHAAINNILLAKDNSLSPSDLTASPSETVAGNAAFVSAYSPVIVDPDGDGVDTVTYSIDSKSGKEVKNLFDHANMPGIEYLTRRDWTGTFPTRIGENTGITSAFGSTANADGTSTIFKLDISAADYEKLRSTDSNNPIADSDYTGAVRFSEKNGLELSEMRGLAYDDPLWDDLIAQMSPDQMTDFIAQGGYGSIQVKSIKKSKTTHQDGPSGFGSGYTFMCPVLLAQTWDRELAKKFGYFIGEECIRTGKNGWYAPAVNIHRTPFSGRNFEYYSEDAFISGAIAACVVSKTAEKGGITIIKHFAFNDFENHRGDREGDKSGVNEFKWDLGIATWFNEQSAREIYLKPFEAAIKSGTHTSFYYKKVTNEDGVTELVKTDYEIPNCNGIMSSFNRVGYTWAGGDYNLITGLLRTEWGFDGVVVTDFDNGGYMDTVQNIRAGADIKLHPIGKQDYSGKSFKIGADVDKATYYYAKEAVRHCLYAEVNSLAANGTIKGVSNETVGYHVFILLGVDILAAAGVGVLAFLMIRKLRKKSI